MVNLEEMWRFEVVALFIKAVVLKSGFIGINAGMCMLSRGGRKYWYESISRYYVLQYHIDSHKHYQFLIISLMQRFVAVVHGGFFSWQLLHKNYCCDILISQKKKKRKTTVLFKIRLKKKL